MKIVLSFKEVALIVGKHVEKLGMGHGAADISVLTDGTVEVVFDKWGPSPEKRGLRVVKK